MYFHPDNKSSEVPLSDDGFSLGSGLCTLSAVDVFTVVIRTVVFMHVLLFADDKEFVLVQSENFWVRLFLKHFVEAPEDTNKDDLLFYVRKTITKSRLNIPQVRSSNVRHAPFYVHACVCAFVQLEVP